MCLLPMANFAQTTFKYISLPKLVIDSVTKLRTLRVTTPVDGANKDKLAVVLNKWFAQNYTGTNNDSTGARNDAKVLHGEGLITGSITSRRLGNNDMGDRVDKLTVNVPPVNYKVRFTVEVIITAGKYEIVINHLTLEFFDMAAPFELYYTGSFPTVVVPAENRGTDLGDIYVRMFEDIDFNLHDVAKSAQKNITKARKKGDL